MPSPGEPFWNAAAQESKPLAVEDLQAAFEAVRRQMDAPRPRCPHLYPYSYVKGLRDRGITETTCGFCGSRVRV